MFFLKASTTLIQGGFFLFLLKRLPGAFDGAHAIERAYAAFREGKVKGTGAMVHWVIPEVDRGDVLIQRDIAIQEDDTLQTLEERIHAVEHVLIVDGVAAALAINKK